MARKRSKKETLEYLVAEVDSAKAILKKLFKQQLLLADEISRIVRVATPGVLRSKPTKKSAKAAKKSGPATPRVAGRPVLVHEPQSAGSPPRTGT